MNLATNRRYVAPAYGAENKQTICGSRIYTWQHTDDALSKAPVYGPINKQTDDTWLPDIDLATQRRYAK